MTRDQKQLLDSFFDEPPFTVILEHLPQNRIYSQNSQKHQSTVLMAVYVAHGQLIPEKIIA